MGVPSYPNKRSLFWVLCIRSLLFFHTPPFASLQSVKFSHYTLNRNPPVIFFLLSLVMSGVRWSAVFFFQRYSAFLFPPLLPPCIPFQKALQEIPACFLFPWPLEVFHPSYRYERGENPVVSNSRFFSRLSANDDCHPYSICWPLYYSSTTEEKIPPP